MATKVDDWVKLSQLQGDEYDLIQRQEDLKQLCEHVGNDLIRRKVFLFKKDYVTGAVVKHGDGEYEEVWFTTNNAYYALTSDYIRVI
jgi:hypothetical protein